MIAGHLGFAAAAASGRRTALTLRWIVAFGVAAVLPDVADLLFAVTGTCNPSGLYSHTLPAVVMLASIAGGATQLITGRRADATLVGLLVLAHAPADFVTGNKLFWPGGELQGWQLYRNPLADFVLEVTLFAGGCALLGARRRMPSRTLSIVIVIVTVLVQAGFNVVTNHADGLKPNACAEALTSS